MIHNADRSFPAFRQLFRKKFPPLLQNLTDRFLPDFNPFVQAISNYRHEVTALLGNAAAATNAEAPNPGASGRPPKVSYLRAMPSLGPESVATFEKRTANNRSNAYIDPGAYSRLGEGLLSYETRACGAAGLDAHLDPNSPNDPAFNSRVGGNVADAQDFFDRIKRFAFGDVNSTANVPASRCKQQPDVKPIGKSGSATQYPQVFRHK